MLLQKRILNDLQNEKRKTKILLKQQNLFN